ncbi:3,4-dihydroxy-2-butanone-4-phosphate synthase [Methanosphaerula palustris]|uniref:3,4-dihydroxy-2-butanone 4-phosphate synthase n=1 Tax=Methanosphaerula palustris (strain ATCC BAA-1556 / DSM 19958 / E1-9c) TaxID=521011 RepID=B8GET6_METPE|nr:3,4-dihydroxy-2-butanone-4-phosphate synthase [Methanosphaerula palustris]ACL17787.1 3,4-dihydroxy-2-butanone 4-phosphate synthase [Methanosphaerula palustris E1-9c]
MIDDALNALRDGKMILLYDFADREGETDFAICADVVTPQHILQMRKDGGGLICTAIDPVAAKLLHLPFATDLLQATGVVEQDGEIPYDRSNHSSFSIWVNHKKTFTGIPDRDRALTISSIGAQVKKVLAGEPDTFHAEFRTPGHVALLRAADDLLAQRCGQTELSVTLARMAGVTPAIAICEMLDDETGLALKKDDAIRYAQDHGLVFVEGKDVFEATGISCLHEGVCQTSGTNTTVDC